MRKTIYYMHKPGEERDFSFVTMPAEYWLDTQLRAGYLLYRVDIEVPDYAETRSAPVTGPVELVGVVGSDLKAEVG